MGSVSESPSNSININNMSWRATKCERLARAAIKLKRVSAALFLQLARFTNNIERAFPKRRKSFFGLILQVTTTSSWRRRKTRHSGEPPGGVVRSGFSTPRQNGSETNKKVRAALTRDCQWYTGGRWGWRQVRMALMGWATHVLQWQLQWEARL